MARAAFTKRTLAALAQSVGVTGPGQRVQAMCAYCDHMGTVEWLSAEAEEALRTHHLNYRGRRKLMPHEIITTTFEIDHVFPWSRGGSDDPSNLAYACRPCNTEKRNRTPEEWLGVAV